MTCGVDPAGSLESPVGRLGVMGRAADTPPALGRAHLCGASGSPPRTAAAADEAPPGFCTPVSRRSAVGSPTGDMGSPAKDGSLTGRLKNFANKIFHKATTPLLPAKVDDSSSIKLPTRSRRIAANPLSKYPVAKRGEILAMRKMGFIESQPTVEGQLKLDAMFEGRPGDARALQELLADEESQQRPRRRRGAWGHA